MLFAWERAFKDPLNCEMGMCGMVTCRPTVAYIVQVDCANISNWTDYKLLPKRNIDNAVLMLDQRLWRWSNIELTLAECTMFEGKLSCQYIHEISCFAIPEVVKSVSLQT